MIFIIVYIYIVFVIWLAGCNGFMVDGLYIYYIYDHPNLKFLPRLNKLPNTQGVGRKSIISIFAPCRDV
jgi:hypothetical protein